MIIDKDTEMLLFRFNNYKNYSFLNEHLSVLKSRGHVWMMKFGRRSNVKKIESIMKSGGWIILRAPKSDGSGSFLAKFSVFGEKAPDDDAFPVYYHDILNRSSDEFDYSSANRQWFRLEVICPISETDAASFIISKTGKKVDEVIKTTRTAVMFVENESTIEVRETK